MTFFLYNEPIVIKLGNRLDLESGNLLKQQVDEIRPELYPFWVIDMEEVEFINSAGLSALVKGFNCAKQQGCRLVICNVPTTVRMILEITQLDRVFEIRDSFEGFLNPMSETSQPAVA